MRFLFLRLAKVTTLIRNEENENKKESLAHLKLMYFVYPNSGYNNSPFKYIGDKQRFITLIK
jgi:hypothetical protein